MDPIVIKATEIAQLASIGPAIFLLMFLMCVARNYSLVILPILFFISLTCSFLLPILAFFPELDTDLIRLILMFNEHLAPELSFLLILQFVMRKPPPWPYWLILGLPLVGGGHFFYLSVLREDACFSNDICMPAETLMIWYRAIGSCFVFLLLTMMMRYTSTIGKKDANRLHKYWLIVMLILYNLAILALYLSRLAQEVDPQQFDFIKTMVGVTFIYLVPSSVFRVFNRNLDIRPLSQATYERDQRISRKIMQIMQVEKPYRDMDFNRAVLADRLGLTEQHLSRVMNNILKKNFHELVNEHRINDAKNLLENTDDTITSISFDVGFGNISSFNRIFKEYTNLSPSEFRASMNKAS